VSESSNLVPPHIVATATFSCTVNLDDPDELRLYQEGDAYKLFQHLTRTLGLDTFDRCFIDFALALPSTEVGDV